MWIVAVAIPAAAALVGGLLAAYRPPRPARRSLVQHFAAGVVLAALAVELIPGIERGAHRHGVLVMGFALGIGCLYLLARLEAAAREGRAPAFLAGVVPAALFDVAIDGVTVGAGLAASEETGLVLAAAIALELLFVTLSIGGGSRRRTLLVTVLAAGVFAGSSVAGAALLGGAPRALVAGVLAFSAAALIYLVTEGLLVEAHEQPDPARAPVILLLGFLTFWGVRMLAGG